MSETVEIGLQLALVAIVFLLLPIAYRVIQGPTQAERLQAIDALSIMLSCVLVVLAALQSSGMMVDVALALAAFSFIATLGIARYMAQGRVF